MRAQEHADQYADLAGRRDIADRREDHRGEDEQERKRPQETDADDFAAMRLPAVAHRMPLAPRGGWEEERADYRAGVVLAQRWHMQRGHRVFVPKRIGGDATTSENSVKAALAQAIGIGRAMAAARDDEHADQDKGDADQSEPARPLAEENHRTGGRKERARAARERVDQREVADIVAALQNEVVSEVNEAGAEQEPPAERTDHRALPEPVAGN